MYFKGGKGIKDPVDIEGKQISLGDILSTDYGDDDKYGLTRSDEKKNEPFYKVELHEKGYFFARSIEEYDCFSMGDKRFYLHDFRFKYCKLLMKGDNNG